MPQAFKEFPTMQYTTDSEYAFDTDIRPCGLPCRSPGRDLP
jgi:hypothetical protein